MAADKGYVHDLSGLLHPEGDDDVGVVGVVLGVVVP